jgi:hypothetical protein
MLGTQDVHSSIRRSGELEYNDGIVFDHRGLYVDLDPMILLVETLTIQLRLPPVDLYPRTRRRQKHIWTTWTTTFWITRSVNGSTN